ncbi:MAG: MBL fold metallo-hydrolase [Anaeromyxobacter sp.]
MLRVTHVGTACALLEIDVPDTPPLRLLTDPAFDPPGRRYHFGWGTSSTKLERPALDPAAVGRLDAVLLSHDQHADNLDDAGRRLVEGAPLVVTTRGAARRIGGAGHAGVRGLRTWESVEVGPVRITATPARHGPPLSLPFVGPVIGFVLEWPGQERGAVYVTGDTVRFGALAEVGRRFRIGTLVVHMGGVGFPLYGPIRFTMRARDAARLARDLGVEAVVPVHYAGWRHFLEPRAEAERAFAEAGLSDRIRWLEPGTASVIA